MATIKKATLHPVNNDGTLDTDTSIYPETNIGQVKNLSEVLQQKEYAGKMTINNQEYTVSKHTLSWTESGTTYTYEVLTV